MLANPPVAPMPSDFCAPSALCGAIEIDLGIPSFCTPAQLPSIFGCASKIKGHPGCSTPRATVRSFLERAMPSRADVTQKSGIRLHAV